MFKLNRNCWYNNCFQKIIIINDVKHRVLFHHSTKTFKARISDMACIKLIQWNQFYRALKEIAAEFKKWNNLILYYLYIKYSKRIKTQIIM